MKSFSNTSIHMMKRQSDGEYPPVCKKRRNEFGHRNRELTTILISNLPKSYNQSKIRKLFQDCGVISRIDTCESPKKDFRLARVEFTTHDEALSALTRSHKQIGTSNEIDVRLLENSTLWITNFPPRFNQRDIRELFKSIGISVLSVRLPSLRYNSNRRFAYVDVCREQEVEQAIAHLNSEEFEGYTLVVKRSNPLEKSKRSDASVWERREILIRHLDPKVTEDNLKGHYSRYGVIEYVKIVPKNDNPNGGNSDAFISFSEQEAANRALETNRMQFQGSEIVVRLTDRKTYLERQEVKKILSRARSRSDPCILSLYPLNDKVSKTHIQKLLQEKASVDENDIKKIYLVTDLHGSLVILKDRRLAAKCLLALNGISFQNSTIYCGNITDLQNDAKKSRIQRQRNQDKKISPLFSGHQTEIRKQLSNDEFRKMLLKK